MTTESGFQLSGNAPENYDTYTGVFMDPFITEIVRRGAPRPGDAVLDVACGTGKAAREAYRIMSGRGSVHGLDLNAGMLDVAAAKAAEQGSDITWHEASAEDMPVADESFDVVLCSQGIMFFPDLRRGLGEMARVARSDGRIVCSFWAGPIARSPYMASFNTHSVGTLSPAAMQVTEQAFGIETDDVGAILAELSVVDIVADTVALDIVLPPVEEYLPGHIASLPFAAEFAALPEGEKKRQYRRVEADLEGFAAAGGGFEVPFVLHFVSGVKG